MSKQLKRKLQEGLQTSNDITIPWVEGDGEVIPIGKRNVKPKPNEKAKARTAEVVKILDTVSSVPFLKIPSYEISLIPIDKLTEISEAVTEIEKMEVKLDGLSFSQLMNVPDLITDMTIKPVETFSVKHHWSGVLHDEEMNMRIITVMGLRGEWAINLMGERALDDMVKEMERLSNFSKDLIKAR